MKKLACKKVGVLGAGIVFACTALAGTVTDNFNASRNYLTQGLAGSVWDGLYTGAGQIPDQGVGAGPGSTFVMDANISASNRLTVASTQTDWEVGADDGVLLWKLVYGDFDMSVHIDFIQALAYNTLGLMARLPGPGGTSENNVSFTRFDEYGIANYFRYDIGGTTTRRPIFEANTNYWLRLTRVGDTFFAYERGATTEDWVLRDQQDRPDMTGLPVQAGISQASYDSGTNFRTGQFSGFSLTGPYVNAGTKPPQITGLTIGTNAGSGKLVISWTPGAGSDGSFVLMHAAGAISAQPSDLTAYAANAAFGSGDQLGAGNYVIFAGSGSTVTVSNLSGATNYSVAAYSYAGSGTNIGYTLVGALTASQSPPAVVTSISVQLPDNLQTNGIVQAVVTATFDSGSTANATAASTYQSSDTTVLTVSTNGLVTGATAKLPASATITVTYQGKQATKTVTLIAPPAPVLVHRYTFNTDTKDSVTVGAVDGVLNGTAAVSGGALVLDGSAAGYLDLPGMDLTALTAITWEAWVTDNGSGTWARIFDIGNSSGGSGTRYMFLTLPTSDGRLRVAYTTGGGGAEQVVNWAAASGARPAVGKKTHIVFTSDPETRRGVFYIDGVQVNTVNTAFTLTPQAVGVTTNNWLGRSQYSGDAYFNGAIDEFRVYKNAMTPLQAAIDAALGPNSIVTDPGALQSINLLASTTMNPGTFQSAGVAGNFAQASNVNITALSPTYSSSDTNVLTVTATGRINAIGQGTASITANYGGFSGSKTIAVVPTAAPVLTHRYSFNGNVNDSVGGANGTLDGSAAISSGQVVLDGSGWVTLPAGLINGYDAVTIESWVDFPDANGGPMYLWCLGDTTANGAAANYIRLASATPANTLLTLNGPVINNGVPVGGVAQNVSWGSLMYGKQHVVAVIDPPSGAMRLYLNGIAINTNSITVPLSGVANNFSYIGRSLATVDAFYFLGSIDEFRIYKGALNLQQIRTSLAAGPDQAIMDSGSIQSLALETPAAMIQGTLRLPVVRGSSASVTNIHLTRVPGVTLTSSDTNVITVTSDLRLRAGNPGAATVTATFGTASVSQRVSVVAKQPALMHRYTFDKDMSDSVGGATGTAWGHAKFNGAGGVDLDGSRSTYLQLPYNLIDGYPALTIEAWATIGTAGGDWTRLFDFGNYNTANPPSGQSYFFLAPHAAGGTVTRVVMQDGTAGEQIANVTGILDGTGRRHIVAVFNTDTNQGPKTVKVYLDGAPVATNSAVAATADMTRLTDNWNFIGRSLYGADTYLNATVDEFRIYYGQLTPSQIAADFAAGSDGALAVGPPVVVIVPSLIATASAGSIVLTWPDSASGFALESTPVLGSAATWNAVTVGPASGGKFTVTLPMTGTAQYFRLKK